MANRPGPHYLRNGVDRALAELREEGIVETADVAVARLWRELGGLLDAQLRPEALPGLDGTPARPSRELDALVGRFLACARELAATPAARHRLELTDDDPTAFLADVLALDPARGPETRDAATP